MDSLRARSYPSIHLLQAVQHPLRCDRIAGHIHHKVTCPSLTLIPPVYGSEKYQQTVGFLLDAGRSDSLMSVRSTHGQA